MKQENALPQLLRSAIKRTPFFGDFLRGIVRPDDPNLQKVSSQIHNQVIFYHNGIPVPPIRLRDMVRKGAILPEDFILEGRQVYDSVVEYIRKAGGEFEKNTKIFEFGVGCGRVARHFLTDGSQDFLGTDVDAELIDWCANNLLTDDSVRFIANDYEPPLDIESASLDIGYSISVFTHMTAENQRMWAAELSRVMRPGSFLFVSFLERRKSELPQGVAVLERQDKEFDRSWLGKGGAPNVYFHTYNTRENIQELFATDFEVKLYAEKVIRNTQSAIVLRRKGAER